MGGVCVALYGFIAVSGLKMIQKSDLEDNRNLFTVSVILIAGIGGLSVSFGKVTITEVACALILGIITNLILKGGYVEGQVVDAKGLKAVAKLPTKEQLLSMFCMVLNEPISGFARAIKSVAEKNGAPAEAAAPAETPAN